MRPGVTEETLPGSDRVGINFPIKAEQVVIAIAQVFPTHTLLQADGSIATTPAECYGVLSEAVDSTSGATRSIMYVTGVFPIDKINFNGVAPTTAVVDALKDRNIYLETSIPE